MNYETAKSLKDAGFPQDGATQAYMVDGIMTYVLFPTLEEIIEACGRPIWFESNIGMLGEEAQEIWVAGRNRGMGEKFGTGLTPTEAVAMLWLALNK